jgi:hypothetical protein
VRPEQPVAGHMITLVQHRKGELLMLDDNDALHPNKECPLDIQTKVKVYQAAYVVQPGESFFHSFNFCQILIEPYVTEKRQTVKRQARERPLPADGRRELRSGKKC